MNETVLLLVLIIGIVISETCAQACANNLMHSNNNVYLLGGAVFYMIVVYLLASAHKYAPMGIVNAIWSGLSILAISLLGLYYGQTLHSDQIIAMTGIAAGVMYLSKYNVEY